MKLRAQHGFTLLEVLAVIVIILVIAGWILTGSKSPAPGRVRAEGEIKDMAMACENFKVEYGTYPRSDTLTEMVTGGDAPIDPQRDGNPNSDAYKKASAFLYVALSGDDDMDGKLTPPAERSKGFMDFGKNEGMLNVRKNADGRVTKVNYIQDPFGYSYGYSTAAARQEDDFNADAKANGGRAQRASRPAGYNPNFDLWSTAGKVTTTPLTDSDRNGWVKNW